MGTSFIEVNKRLKPEERENFVLRVDAIYGPASGAKNISGDVLYKLFPVGSSGGFRIAGPYTFPKLIVLFTTGEVVYWSDELDKEKGIFLYYGDNDKSGKDFHSTKHGGNEALRSIFTWASCNDIKTRKLIPPIFVFEKANGWNKRFLGLAVPGIKGKPEIEWLTAIWGCDENENRFQNYKALFTILDTGATENGSGPDGINLGWINDIIDGKAYESKYAPYAWKKYIDSKGCFKPLISTLGKIYKGKDDQLPSDKVGLEMLNTIHEYFKDKDGGYSFEKFAIDVAQGIDQNVALIDSTQPYKDGGFDGVGKYTIFKSVHNQITVDFYLEAKCYSMSNSVGVKETSRLISRIKNRQFGILVTTSYIADQAYKEIIDDRHPVAFITGIDIVNYLRSQQNILNVDMLKKMLETVYKN